MQAVGWAQVPDGTPGELDVTGPVSWRCPGTFRSSPPAEGPTIAHPTSGGNRAVFFAGSDRSSDNGPLLAGSSGTYTFTLTVPSPSGSVSVSIQADDSSRRGVADATPYGCTVVKHETSTTAPLSPSPSPSP